MKVFIVYYHDDNGPCGKLYATENIAKVEQMVLRVATDSGANLDRVVAEVRELAETGELSEYGTHKVILNYHFEGVAIETVELE